MPPEPRARAIPLDAYTPWINHCLIGGVVGNLPMVKSWKRPRRGPGAPPFVPPEDQVTPLRNRAVIYGVHYILFSRVKTFVSGRLHWRQVSIPVSHLTRTATYVPTLRVGQPVVVEGELLRMRGSFDHVLQSYRPPRLLWGRSGRFGMPEEFHPIAEDGTADVEDFWQDLLGFRGDPVEVP